MRASPSISPFPTTRSSGRFRWPRWRPPGWAAECRCPNLEEMIEGALKPVPKPMGPNARFGYPLRGGFQALMNGFLPHLKGELRLEHARGQRLAH